MKSTRVEILVAAVVLFVSASPVMAVIQFNDGGVWDIDYLINDDVWVDYESPGMGTTLNILGGAGILMGYDVEGWEDSIINILGGSLWDLWARGSSQVAFSGGSMYSLAAFDISQVTVSGGSMGWLFAYDSSQVDVSGGSMLDLLAYDSSQVDVSSGSIGLLVAFGSSQVVLSGGSMNTLFAYDSSQVIVSGGSINSDLYASSNSQVTVSGGLFGSELRVSDTAVLTIDGSDFAVDGTPVGYIELMSIHGLQYTQEPYRRLTGTLLSGDPLNNDFRIGHSAKIVLVPEPATLLLLGLGGLALLRKRR